MHIDETRRLGDAALGTAAVGVGALIASASSFGLPCPFLAVTGLPCPGCGMTRLADAVVHLRLGEAFASDPIGVALLAVVGVLAAVGVAHRIGSTVAVPAGSWRIARVGLAAALGLRWVGTLTGVTPFAG